MRTGADPMTGEMAEKKEPAQTDSFVKKAPDRNRTDIFSLEG